MPLTNMLLLLEYDWSGSPIGAKNTWSSDMKANIAMLMASDFPMCSVWGPQYIQIYNDRYNAIFGAKHPHAFGAPVRENWPEIWEFLGPALDQVWAGATLRFDGALLPLVKGTVPEECYFDFSYSPIRDDEGCVIGALSVASERTAEVVLHRRQGLLDLESAHIADGSIEALQRVLQDVLAANEMDCAMAALYSVAPETAAPDGDLWTVRGGQEFARQMRPLAARALLVGGMFSGGTQPDDMAANAPAVAIPFYALGGAPCCVLVLVPNALVPYEASFLPFARAVSKSMHAGIHKAQRQARDLGQMRDRIAEQDQLYQFLFDHIQDGIAYCATSGVPGDDEVVLAVNARLCEMLGYQADEIIGLGREAFFFTGDGALRSALETRGRQSSFLGELQLRAKDGRQVPVEVSSNLIEVRTGEKRSLTLFRDVSHHKRAEEERVERVRLETIASLAGTLAHDTNNLMTIVVGSAEFLADRLPEGGTEHQMAMNAMVAAERASGLTGQLLLYSKHQPTIIKALDINAFLVEVKPLLASALGELNHLILKQDPELPLCLADPNQLTTALLNLVTNARHAMPGGGTLEIATCRLTSPAPVGLRVADSGTGIAPEIQDRIFEPFFTTKGVGNGTGLGLSIVKRLLDDLGGTMRVSTLPGSGTTFELGFQAADDVRQTPENAQDTAWAKGASILYVEDNETVRYQTEQMLRQLGMDPIVFTGGRKALDWVRAGGTAELLLTDLVLPGGMSGRELAAMARRHRPDLRVVITTGYDPQGALAENGWMDFPILPKPYTRRALQAALRAVLAAHG